eukprot:5613780-Prymnesium_polylepis.2
MADTRSEPYGRDPNPLATRSCTGLADGTNWSTSSADAQSPASTHPARTAGTSSQRSSIRPQLSAPRYSSVRHAAHACLPHE